MTLFFHNAVIKKKKESKMSKDYTFTVSDDVEVALQKKASLLGITTDDLLQKTLEFYLSYVLYTYTLPATAVDLSDSSIKPK